MRKLSICFGKDFRNDQCTVQFTTNKSIYYSQLFRSQEVTPFIGGIVRDEDIELFIKTFKELLIELETGKTDYERSLDIKEDK